MKKVLVVVGIIISAVIISGIIVGLGKNEKTLFNEKIETDNNVLISIKVIESNKGWQPDKTMIISDENEHLIRYAIGFENYTNYLPSCYYCYDINPNEYLVWVYQQNGNEFIYYFNTDTQEKYMLDYNNIGNRTETFYVAVDKVIKSNFLSKIDSKISNMNKWNSYLSNT